MEVIRRALAEPLRDGREVKLRAERLTLAKRRWRGVAGDGREFGFDLEEPLHDGDAFHQADGATYVLEQLPEPVLEVRFGSPAESARAGWLVGNLHFSVEIADGAMLVVDDPALRQMLAREGLVFIPVRRVFHPLHSAHAHAH